jgi:peptidoglycan/xylan/chitin deacetylase (PgdA/CDA1 family)
VGLWNLLDLLDELDIPAAHNINSAALDACPEIAPALRARGDEFVGHGRTNSERQDMLWEEDERRLIEESRDALARHAGVAPRGWLGPYIAQSAHTLDLLREAGFTYVMDWPADDQPFWLTTRAGPILSVPYSVELNDIPVEMIQHHGAGELARRAKATADRLVAEAASPGPLGGPKVMCVAIHPYISGVPHRIAALEALFEDLAARPEVAFMQGREIADWYLASGDPT